MSVFKHILNAAVVCSLLGFAMFSLEACSGDGGTSSDAQDDTRQSDTEKNNDKSQDQDPSKGDSTRSSLGAEVDCPEVTSKSQFLNPDIDYGEIVDSRDGRTYKTVKIGKQTWFAENLNYASDKSVCADSLDKDCEIYGRLYVYSWEMCPEGWHVPTMPEWSELFSSAGGFDNVEGAMLKSKFGWRKGIEGLDAFGFSLAPKNSRSCTHISVMGEGMYENNSYSVNCVHFGGSISNFDFYSSSLAAEETGCAVGYVKRVEDGVPIRCIKDEENTPDGASIDKDIDIIWENVSKEELLNPNVEYGELVDERDGQTYKTVQIGAQTWMAQNLNYAYVVDSLQMEYMCGSFSGRYDVVSEEISACDLYGKIYSYTAAMDSAAVFSDDGKGCRPMWCVPNKQVRGICPEGWRLPSVEDWNALYETVGGAEVAAKKLKSLTGWYYGGNGTDDYGFSALPAVLGSLGNHSYTGFWSAGTIEDGQYFNFYSDAVFSGSANKMYIRCVKGYTHVDDPSRYILGPDPSTVEKGTVTDARDGQTYKTVKIGNQTWMAENLNYAYQEDNSVYGSICRTDSAGNCEPYGRYYTWPAAMDSAGVFSNGGKGCGFEKPCKPTGIVRGVCPEGWHLPDSTEWKDLFATLKCDETYNMVNCAHVLKSEQGWYTRSNGFDYYGFAVLPADYIRWQFKSGTWIPDLSEIFGTNAYFWSSSESDDDKRAIEVDFDKLDFVEVSALDKYMACPIRCLKD